jgi:hypothetical protein
MFDLLLMPVCVLIGRFYMLLVLLVFYAIGIAFFCLSTLLDLDTRKEISGPLGWYFAIMLPIVAMSGPFLHFFEPAVHPVFYYAFLVLWLTSIIALLDELATLKDLDGGFSIANILAGVVMLAVLFGPGLLLGAIWLRVTPHGL